MYVMSIGPLTRALCKRLLNFLIHICGLWLRKHPPFMLCLSLTVCLHFWSQQTETAVMAGATAVPLQQLIASLDNACLPKILQVCSGVYFQGRSFVVLCTVNWNGKCKEEIKNYLKRLDNYNWAWFLYCVCVPVCQLYVCDICVSFTFLIHIRLKIGFIWAT